MIKRTTRRCLLFAAIVLGWSAAAIAHRLEQYLQATTIAVTREHVILELRLTPGVAVASQILGLIGVGEDGALSQAAQHVYSERVRQDLSLSLDGVPLPLRLTASAYPSVGALRSGLGDITLSFETVLAPSDRQHRLSFYNAHEHEMAVYLVNALVPDDPEIHILGQSRNIDQSRYELVFSMNGSVLPKRQDSGAVLETFFYHGVRHILAGYDHLLFVCALVLAVTTLWDLIKVVTAFTLAHSITLTLAALDFVHLSSHIVEPVIAGSIIFVAVQNIFWPAGAQGRARVAAAFLFGLFHGLGFAGGLLDLMQQMPRSTVTLAILGFSIGVEVGQQLVLLPLFALLRALRRIHQRRLSPSRLLSGLQRAGSAAIAAAGAYYLGLALVG